MHPLRLIVLLAALCTYSSFALAGADGGDGDSAGADNWGEYIIGTNPTNSPGAFLLDVADVHLDGESLQVSLTLQARSSLSFYLLSAEGYVPSNGTWTVRGSILGTGNTVTFVDQLAGSLSHAGRTYMGLVTHEEHPLAIGDILTSLGNMVTTVNRAYVEYPLLDSATVKVIPYLGSPEAFCVAYCQGAYSNQVEFACPPGVTNAYFRLRSPDADPTNAFVEYREGVLAGPWTALDVD